MGTESGQVMQRIFDEVFAVGDASVVDELCSPPGLRDPPQAVRACTRRSQPH